MASDVEQFLESVPLFKELDKRHRGVVAKTVFERAFDAGDAIVREGESGVGVFMIRTDKVEVLKRHGQRDDEERLATLGAGEVFGELALLADFPRSATVRALERTELLGLTAWNFRAELQKSPEMAYSLLRVLAQRLAAADKRLAER